MKKNDNDMVHPATMTSRTITRSGIKKDGKELVVSCGYSTAGKFGYFVCWEQQTARADNKTLHEYSNVVTVKPKANDRTLHEVLADFKVLVDTFKTEQFPSFDININKILKGRQTHGF